MLPFFLSFLDPDSNEVPKVLLEDDTKKAVARMVELWKVEQRHEEDIPLPNYINPALHTNLYR